MDASVWAAVAAWVGVAFAAGFAIDARREARRSGKAATEANAAVVQLQRERNDTLQRLADVAEKPRGSWLIERVDPTKSQYFARNATREDAHQVALSCDVADALIWRERPFEVISPDGHAPFHVVHAWNGRHPTLTITWIRPDGSTGRHVCPLP